MEKEKCNYCDGKGYVSNIYKTSFKKCPVCNGTKEIDKKECNNTSSVEDDINEWFSEM